MKDRDGVCGFTTLCIIHVNRKKSMTKKVLPISYFFFTVFYMKNKISDEVIMKDFFSILEYKEGRYILLR